LEDTLKRAIMLAGSIVVLTLVAAPSRAQAPKGLEGTWEGFMSTNPLYEARLILRVEPGDGGVLQGKAECPEIPSQGTTVFDQVTLKDGTASFVSKSSGREFQGTLNPAGTELVGHWKKGTQSLPLTFTRVEGPVTPSEVWEGAIEINGGIKLRMAFHILKTKGGAIKATMDSPDQGAFGIKVDSVEIGKESLKFSLNKLGEFDGKLEPTGETAVGKWKQGGASLPLTLKRVARVSEVKRPQMPKGPFPYVSEDVVYDSRSKGVKIAGTLTIPEGDGPFPVALLITGSGAQDRDESILGHKPFLVLADDLTRRGIAVLRVDDRGVGGSTGNPLSATTLDFAEDVLGGIDYLKSRPRIDPKQIGLIGHSEGGLIAPIVAAESNDVAYIVLMAGPGLPGDQILAAQLALILRVSGADEATIKTSAATQARLMAIAKENEDPKVAIEKLKAAQAELIKSLPEAERKALAEADPNNTQVAMLASPWFRYFLTYDPRPTLAKVRCPILAINGEKDLQVPCKENLEAIDRAVRSGGNTKVKTREMVGLNHLFQTSKTGAPSEYGTIEETFSPTALQTIGGWILEQTKAK
jgi:uncharacterized protein